MDQEFIQHCQNSELERVTDCLSRGVDVNTVSGDGRWSGLTIAAWQENTELLSVLLSISIAMLSIITSVDVVNDRKWSPIVTTIPVLTGFSVLLLLLLILVDDVINLLENLLR